MKRLFLLIFLIAINYNSLFSSNLELLQSVEVGNEPVSVFKDMKTSTFHIFCKGTDGNFNGVFEPDSGDVAGSWWILNFNNLQNLNAEKVADLPFGKISFIVFKPAFIESERKVFLNYTDGIQAYSLDSYQEIGEKIEMSGATSLEYTSNHLIISKSSSMNQTDTIIVLNTKNNQVYSKYPVGKNLKQANFYLPDDSKKRGIVAISTGGFGSDSSEIHFSEFNHFAQPQFTSKIVGKTVNSLNLFGDMFATISVMMSHKIMLFNIQTTELLAEINLPTTGWNGPSYAIYNGKEVIVVAYNGKLYRYYDNPETTEIDFEQKGEVELSGKGQSFEIIQIDEEKELIAVATPLQSNYLPNNKVDIILKQNAISSVNSDFSSKLYYCADKSIIFDKSNIINNFTLMDINGNILYKANFPINQYDLSHLSSGIYFISFTKNEKIYFEKINLVK